MAFRGIGAGFAQGGDGCRDQAKSAPGRQVDSSAHRQQPAGRKAAQIGPERFNRQPVVGPGGAQSGHRSAGLEGDQVPAVLGGGEETPRLCNVDADRRGLEETTVKLR